jgi:hypothetical protein
MSKKIIVFVLIWMQTQAAPIVILGEGGLPIEFLRYIERNRLTNTYLQNQKNIVAKNSAKFRVQEQFINGKSALLKGLSDLAKSYFFDLAAKSQQGDWTAGEQILITHSFLLLAEISKTNPEKKYWVTRALGFSLGEISDLDSVSPSTRELIQQTKRESTPLALPISLVQDWDVILINGKEIGKDFDRLKVIPDTYRMTFLSSRYQTVTLSTHSNQFMNLNPEKSLLVSGSCENPQLQISPKNSYQVFFSEKCVREWNNEWDRQNIKLLPDYKITSPANFETPKPFYKTNWFWGSLLLIGVVVAVSNQTETTPAVTANEED